MNQGWIYRDRVASAAVGQTLLDYYSQRYQHSSRAEWLQRIQEGQITVETAPGHPEQKLELGQKLAYHRPPWQEPEVPLSFDILYEDEDLMAIAKPSGLPVLPGGGFLEHTLLHQLCVRYPHNPPTPVHRLGRGTSGVILLARSQLAKARLSCQLRESSVNFELSQRIVKTYRALIGASTLPETFRLTSRIGKVPYPPIGYVYAASATGKPAYSQGRVLCRYANRTLLEITIQTGRPHQIRIHLAAAGYPLIGDPLYAPGGLPHPPPSSGQGIPTPGDCGYWLHAHQLHFRHPRTQDEIVVTSPPPPELTPENDHLSLNGSVGDRLLGLIDH